MGKATQSVDRIGRVNQFAKSHGDYQEDTIPERGISRRVLINRGGDTIERWLAAGDPFFKPQNDAVRVCQSLWAVASGKSSLVFDEMGVGGFKWMGETQQSAIDELIHFESRVPRKYWRAFEETARWGKTAGDAGDHLARNPRDQAIAAKHATAMVASLIAMWRGA